MKLNPCGHLEEKAHHRVKMGQAYQSIDPSTQSWTTCTSPFRCRCHHGVPTSSGPSRACMVSFSDPSHPFKHCDGTGICSERTETNSPDGRPQETFAEPHALVGGDEKQDHRDMNVMATWWHSPLPSIHILHNTTFTSGERQAESGAMPAPAIGPNASAADVLRLRKSHRPHGTLKNGFPLAAPVVFQGFSGVDSPSQLKPKDASKQAIEDVPRNMSPPM